MRHIVLGFALAFMTIVSAAACRAEAPPRGAGETSTSGVSPAIPIRESSARPSQAQLRGSRRSNVVRGVAWDANWRDRRDWYGTESARRSLVRVAALNANWIAVTPFAFQESVKRPEISFRDDWSRGLSRDIRHARRLGLKVLVKPHIWSNQFWDGSGNWRGTISMRDAASWQRWFDNYQRWIVRVARLASGYGANAFCIGLEYVKSSRKYPNRWRQIIRAVRAVFSGPLTYAAHLDELDLPFWDQLDAIGVNAYFSVAGSHSPTVETMVRRWQRHAVGLAQLARRHGRPVVFTEVGYASVDGAAMAPYRWPTDKDRADPTEQADCYRALFTAASRWSWFGGMFIWKFKIGTRAAGGPSERHFAFQGKPAEAVIRQGFAQRFLRD